MASLGEVTQNKYSAFRFRATGPHEETGVRKRDENTVLSKTSINDS